MKTSFETLDVSRCEISVLSASGCVIGRRVFCDLDDLRAWLGYWKIAIDGDTGFVRALCARRYSILRNYADHAAEDGSLRLNVIVAGACLSAESVFGMASAAARERDKTHARNRSPRRYEFRHGPVPGTGKIGSYCYFRREIGTYGTHREAAEVCDDPDFAHCTPPVRTSRNAANLPSGRDDIARGIEHSWKRTRRQQWKVAR